MSDLLSSLWRRLVDERSEAGDWKRLRISSVSGAPAYVARSLTNGLEALLLEVPASQIPVDRALPDSAGFEVRAEPVTTGREGTTRLILSLSGPAFQDVFLTLAEDIVAELIHAGDSDRIAHLFMARVKRWQRFLATHGPEGLSEPERRGLFSELLVLRELIEAGCQPDEALDAWEGPDREAHDFVLPGGNLEVKGTASLAPSNISISNLEQLDDTGSAQLILLLTILSENRSMGTTLPELVSEVAGMTQDALGHFKDRLFAAGYLDAHASRYNLPRYQVMGTQAFRIQEGFPRLVAENVPPGVTAARYSISIASLAPFSISQFHLETMLRERHDH